MQVAAAGGQAIEAREPRYVAPHRRQMRFCAAGCGRRNRSAPPQCRRLRSADHGVDGAATKAQVSNLAAKGFAGYLTKPIRQSSLERRVLSLFAGGDELAPAVVTQQRPAASRFVRLKSFWPKTSGQCASRARTAAPARSRGARGHDGQRRRRGVQQAPFRSRRDGRAHAGP